MSFLGGPECSTGSNPLAQFQKQTSADTSLQRDRLSSRQPQQLHGFRSGAQIPEDAAFAEFAQQGPNDSAFHMDQMRREAEHLDRVGGGGGGGAAWAQSFAQKGPRFAPEEFVQQQQQQPGRTWSPQEFKQYREQQMNSTSAARTASPVSGYQPMYGSPMYGSQFGMQRPMMGFQQPQMMPSQQGQQQYEGKGKGRVQELSDTDWEKQFEELSTADKDADLEQLDREANEAMERELNQVDR